ncbi:hypothetical protein [Mariniflexile sp. HMF6888]|uniref:hypothetical protein n=1 Tax=Mariniflexile sp. HMF6888 TaxID=3373086 RepID=UPI0037AB9213
MKKISLVLVIILGFTYGCKAQSQSERITAYKTKIIGTWLSKDDPEYKIVFTNQGNQLEYVNGQLQTEVYLYSITSSCNSNSNGYDIYLKRRQSIDDLNDNACDIVNNIHTDANGVTILSITNDRGQLELYTKQ